MADNEQSLPHPSDFDRNFRAQIANLTGGLVPTPFVTAYTDWAMNLALSPSRQAELQQHAIELARDTWAYALGALGAVTSGETANAAQAPGLAAFAAALGLAPGATAGDGATRASGTARSSDAADSAGARAGVLAPANADPRFADPAWSQFPFNVYARAYQNASTLMKEAVSGVDGVSDYSEKMLDFAVRILLDASSPANFLATNPQLLALTHSENGQNLVRGMQRYLEDARRMFTGDKSKAATGYEVGRDLAITPGKVILRNALIEVIQYEPTTPEVHAEPLLIVPAWIMKYYILDLSPRNSLVRYLVEQGHTVFMMSWKNPEEDDRNVGMDDYVNQGFRAALDAVAAVVPNRGIHAVGYCIGGTLLAICAAALAGEGDERIASITMFAAQTDFSEPGELSLFINPSQLAMLESTMHHKGVLESSQMGGAFSMLRAQDLVWQPMVDRYLKGKSEKLIDLMAWNADGTRMPWRMHTEYLYRLYLNNALASNRFQVNGKLVRLSDIRQPMFIVGTETDHVAPWKSVYKTDNLVRSDDISFLLTSGGHNAGIVSGPVHPKRHYRLRRRQLADPHLAPEDWIATTPKQAGSWWPAWQSWLVAHSSGLAKPPRIGNARKGYEVVEDAPGQYVRKP